MKPLRAGSVRSVILVAGLSLMAVLAADPPSHASQAELLLQPTPLVLRDGRIANVSIHLVPFAPGQAELAAEAEARVATLTRTLGTDCFLTAQVIGHIDSSEVAQDDTLSAHRLARARAAAVQASLVGGGLPAKAIASVWDWQFMVRAPQATLWVFQLTVGEDCEGRPLHGELVAQAPAQPERATAAGTEATAPVVAPVEQTARAAEPTATRPQAQTGQAPAAAPSVTQSMAQPQPQAPAQPAEQLDTETAVAGKPAVAPKAADGKVEQRDKETALAAKPAPDPKPAAGDENVRQREKETVLAAKPARAPRAAASDGNVARDSEGSLVITFATNSSYFPSGASRGLRELIAGIEPESQYEVILRVAISGTNKVAGAKSPKEAARYNKWLAERRLERVQSWLLENAAADALSIKPEYVADDESRQVIVRLAPVG